MLNAIRLSSLVVISSNINEVIRVLNEVLNSLFIYFIFFYETILHALKVQTYKDATKQKHKNANKGTKIKNALEKHLRGKKSLICLFGFLCFFSLEVTKIENRKNRKVPKMHVDVLVSLRMQL